MRRGHRAGIGPFKAGVIAVVTIAVFAYFGFTKSNPFSHPYELKAIVNNANNLMPNSPVRTAGVEVGKVKKVQALSSGNGAAKITMELKDKGLPIHKDATMKLRERIFLEGNLFVDLSPGSPSSPTLKTGSTLRPSQTSAPVQFGQLLSVLQSDVRTDLKTFLREFGKGLDGKGARGFNQSIKYWESAYRDSSLANDAQLGTEPRKDTQRILSGQGRAFGALARDENALKDLITNFNVTFRAFAREDIALGRTVPALRDLVVVGQPSLRHLNAALPSLRAFARDALPGARSSVPALDAQIPLIKQLRRLVRRSELRGLVRELRRRIPALVAFNRTNVPLLDESRQFARCSNNVLVPFSKSRFPNVAGLGGPDVGDLQNQLVSRQLGRPLVGLSGESRLTDGNGTQFHVQLTPNADQNQPAPPNDIVVGKPPQPPPRRPDVPCETQDPPNLAAPVASAAALGTTPAGRTRFNRTALQRAGKLWTQGERDLDALKRSKAYKQMLRNSKLGHK
jgi:phospholipid/cholesterol/gamma-HCH transport system substrate-binding protein